MRDESITYRNLLEQDVEHICAFPQNEVESFYAAPKIRYPWLPEQMMSVAMQRRSLTVVVDAVDRPIAYANLYDFELEAGCCWLGNVLVSPAYRGQAVASYLVEVMMNRAKDEHGCTRLKLYCHNTNTRALLLYSKLGFRPCGSKTVTNHEGQRIVAIEMEKNLMESPVASS
ncbi:GNAT family N-acetyltransferase [Paenibacillus guangzhouensis]|uniref:GNAT family N-acetyltransferase n=1 Tax=Paenibacillus guangzhouensis TaxID=1473112 RepID=UPI001266CE95|nr:GNAT family N-acetyltransferase [Paenibacillus guangzhouensis]